MKSLVHNSLEIEQSIVYNTQEKLKLLVSSSCPLCDRMVELYEEVKNDLPYDKLVEVVNIERVQDYILNGLNVSSVPCVLVNSKKGWKVEELALTDKWSFFGHLLNLLV
ncbi:MAG: thioredoxin family protein [Candidatus Kariarchaeaceae archaeon]